MNGLLWANEDKLKKNTRVEHIIMAMHVMACRMSGPNGQVEWYRGLSASSNVLGRFSFTAQRNPIKIYLF